MQRFGASQRQPRALLQLSRTVSRYELVARDQSALEMRIKEITQVRVHYGAPRMYVMLRREVAKALDKWAYENGVEIDFSRPGKPTDNAKNESFNGRFREECLNAHWFLSLEDARRKIEVWREYYNEARPHSALQWMTPAEFARQCTDRAGSARPEEPEFSS